MTATDNSTPPMPGEDTALDKFLALQKDDIEALPILDVAALTGPRDLETEDVPIPSLRGSVRVRGLTRDESHDVSNAKGTRAREVVMVRMAMVAPEMSNQQVADWQKHAPAGEWQDLTAVITRLSGLDEDAEREDVARFRPES